MGGQAARRAGRWENNGIEQIAPGIISHSRTNDPGHYFCDAKAGTVMTNKFNLGGHQCFIAGRGGQGARAGSSKSRKVEKYKKVKT